MLLVGKLKTLLSVSLLNNVCKLSCTGIKTFDFKLFALFSCLPIGERFSFLMHDLLYLNQYLVVFVFGLGKCCQRISGYFFIKLSQFQSTQKFHCCNTHSIFHCINMRWIYSVYRVAFYFYSAFLRMLSLSTVWNSQSVLRERIFYRLKLPWEGIVDRV